MNNWIHEDCCVIAPVNQDLVEWTEELCQMAGELPHGIWIRPDHSTGNILVTNEEVGFCVTAQAMKDGLYKTQFPAALKFLINIAADPEKIEEVKRLNQLSSPLYSMIPVDPETELPF